MIKPKRSNKTASYRKLTGKTGSQLAKILNEGKSNISNMESEKGHPVSDYLRVLNLTEDELTAPIFPILPHLREEHTPVKVSQSGITYTTRRTNEYGVLNEGFNPEILRDKENSTDYYVFYADKDYTSLNIKKDCPFKVYPSPSYKKGDYVLFKHSLRSYSAGKIVDKSTILSIPDKTEYNIISTEIIGKIKP